MANLGAAHDEDEPAQSADAADEEHNGEEHGGDAEPVAGHLREAVEGNFRMKRLLERDDDDPETKRSRISSPEHEAITNLLSKWSLSKDVVCRYVLSELTLEELQFLDSSNYKPNTVMSDRSAPDCLGRHIKEVRERSGQGGGQIDVVSAFTYRFSLDTLQGQALRQLNHKDLRYVLNNFDGTQPLEEVIREASGFETEVEGAETSCLAAGGINIVSRISRLELIDPVADAAVFGDANLTFALCLAAHRKALGHVGRVIATTFEDLPTLRERYTEIDESINTLEQHYAEVHHSVDCTRIAIDGRFKAMEGSFGAVYYNFPHSGAVGGFFDGHPIVNWRHENLMRLFFRALRSFVKPGGSVKVASNQSALGVRFSYITNSALTNEFIHVETMPFTQWRLHTYGRAYGDRRDVRRRLDAANNQSYNAQRTDLDMVYCFSYAPSGEPLPDSKIIVTPPSLKTLLGCTDGPFQSLSETGRQNLAQQLRNRFVTEASGTHVG